MASDRILPPVHLSVPFLKDQWQPCLNRHGEAPCSFPDGTKLLDDVQGQGVKVCDTSHTTWGHKLGCFTKPEKQSANSLEICHPETSVGVMLQPQSPLRKDFRPLCPLLENVKEH